MRIQFDEETNTYDVFLRQSWLGDARDCLEKGRYLMTQPELSIPSEAAVIGTSLHAGAEAFCRDDLLTRDEVVALAVAAYDDLITQPMKWVNHTVEQARDEVVGLAKSWYRNLAPHVTSPTHVEQEFCIPFDTYRDDLGHEVNIWMKGTIDLVQTDSVWDWKSGKRKYSWRDKQSDAIQPTVYAAAAVHEGWLSWPVQFKYGLVQRTTFDSQIVHVTRTPDHVEWLKRQIRPVVALALRMGTQATWPSNDQHGLCNDVWCPYWSQCKGANLAPVPFPQSRKKAS